MNNIWEFLVMTLTVSIASGLLLIIKTLLGDKLTPRWQYGIWSLLALRMLVPVAVSNRYILIPVPLWVETLKALCESRLSSAYAQEFVPLESPWFLPMISSAPHSITDWLFVIYIAGVVISLLLCLASYVKLRLLIAKAVPLSEVNESSIGDVCNKYGLKACRAVEIEGLPSAFVCGIIKPVLVLPAGMVTDEKIILHELLHLKYKDALQSVIWTVFRALHWCNPFMHYVFNCISNDMEALCDRRVLELLEGEERRDYGKILLLMANDRYPRAFGTTSLSNGGKNIAKRIACIAHFKKYPKGMALVSVCIGIMLLQPLFLGSEFHGVASSINDYSASDSVAALQKDMASARLNRCTTVAGAIDTYAKGLIYENGLYLAAASPLSEQERLYDEMCRSRDDGWIYTHIEDRLGGSAYADAPDPGLSVPAPYEVYNIKSVKSNPNMLQCELIIYMTCIYSSPEQSAKDSYPVLTDGDGNTLPGIAVIPLILNREDGGWTVTPSGKPVLKPMEPNFGDSFERFTRKNTTPAAIYRGKGMLGNITASAHTAYHIDNTATNQSDFSWFGGGGINFNREPVTNAKFQYADIDFTVAYTFAGGKHLLKKISYVTLEDMPYDNAADIPTDSEARMDGNNFAPIKEDAAGSSSTGWSYIAQTYDNKSWDGTITDINSGERFYPKGNTDLPVKIPEAIVARVYIDGLDTEYIISKEVTADEQ